MVIWGRIRHGTNITVTCHRLHQLLRYPNQLSIRNHSNVRHQLVLQTNLFNALKLEFSKPIPFTTQHRNSIKYFIQFARHTANMPEIFKQVRAMGSTCEASAFRKVRRAHMKYELTTICKIPYLTKGGYK